MYQRALVCDLVCAKLISIRNSCMWAYQGDSPVHECRVKVTYTNDCVYVEEYTEDKTAWTIFWHHKNKELMSLARDMCDQIEETL